MQHVDDCPAEYQTHHGTYDDLPQDRNTLVNVFEEFHSDLWLWRRANSIAIFGYGDGRIALRPSVIYFLAQSSRGRLS